MTIMKLYNKLQPYFIIFLSCLLSTIVLWLPFLLKIGQINFQYIYRNFDGLLYIIPAKTFYQINQIDIPGQGLIVSLPLGPKYFAAHLPLYPLFIRLFAYVFGYLKSMLFVNVFFTVGLSAFFFYLLKQLKLSEKPLVLTLVFLFLPRFLVVRSVGAPESLFIFLILLSLYFFEKSRYWLAGIFGCLATMTKTPGVLLVAVYFLVFIEQYLKTKKLSLSMISILLIPLGLFLVFLLYYFQLHDFLAYFHTGGVVKMPYPFSVFNWQAKWVGTAWLEDVIFYFFIYALTAVSLFRSKYRSFFYFSAVFFLATVFVQHRDISRYSLPLWPLACIAFEKYFTDKRFLIALLIVLPGIYLYAWNFLSYNVMPVADWRPFL
jgi:Gpi18-like mannosyltransferase